jgi:hypothetical protein
MDNKRSEIEDFMREKLKSNWPFISIVELNRKMGFYPKDELNIMLKEQLIKKREGINGVLIEVKQLGILHLRGENPGLVNEIHSLVK